MKNIDLDNLYKWVGIFGVALVSVSIAYYLLVFLPGKEAYKRQSEEVKKVEELSAKQDEDDRKRVESCLSNASRIRTSIVSNNDKFSVETISSIQRFEDIFYSTKTSSCLYIMRNIYPGTEGAALSKFIVKNADTDTVIESVDISQENYNQLLKKYKD